MTLAPHASAGVKDEKERPIGPFFLFWLLSVQSAKSADLVIFSLQPARRCSALPAL